MAEEEQQKNVEIRALLIPWYDSNLLLPNSAVVEVLRYPEISLDSNSSSDWIEGTFYWRNLQLPLIALDKLLGLARSETGKKKRILVCHVLSDEVEPAFIGITVQGMPRLINLESTALEIVEDYNEEDAGPVVARVSTLGASALIPDLEEVGQLLQASV